ncbi:hypothetical protein H0H92_015600 [Tricholoma furcatifolium]|nr:hypothetical protein H0H92_015600 [Tricholoma furcatifolium]
MKSTDYPYICPVNEDLEAFMRGEIKARNLNVQHMEKLLPLAASLIERQRTSRPLLHSKNTFYETYHNLIPLWKD